MRIGKTYLERGEPVELIVRWAAPRPSSRRLKSVAPRNVLIARRNGELVVRPFRGLRKVDR